MGSKHGFDRGGGGDADRAPPCLFGSTSAGQSMTWLPGVWYLYIATNQRWRCYRNTAMLLQRSYFSAEVSAVGGTCRNLLDFFDITIDKEGRLLVAGEDG